MTQLNIIEDRIVGCRYKPGLEFTFTLAIPCAESAEYALLVDHDGQNDANVKALLRLADEGRAPYCISLGVRPGTLCMKDGSKRNMLMNSYDLFDREYGDFLVYELIPYITEKYSLPISASPDMHLISGGSSGTGSAAGTSGSSVRTAASASILFSSSVSGRMRSLSMIFFLL